MAKKLTKKALMAKKAAIRARELRKFGAEIRRQQGQTKSRS